MAAGVRPAGSKAHIDSAKTPTFPSRKSTKKLGGASNGLVKEAEGEKKPPPLENRRGNSTKNLAPPRKNQNLAPPRIRQKKGRWIELKPGTVRKDGTRLYYPKYRRWKAGNKQKEWIGTVPDLDPMTESEKTDYVNKNKIARKLRKRRKNRQRNG